MHATVAGFAARNGVDGEDISAQYTKVANGLKQVEARIAVFIIPRTPKTDEEIDAFTEAVYLQYEHEQSDEAQQLASIPPGVSSFSIGSFSATMKNGGGRRQELFPSGLHPNAYSTLMLAGLLYRGVRT